MNVKGFVKRQLTKREDKRYERLLRSRRTTYGQWVQAIEAGLRRNLSIWRPEECRIRRGMRWGKRRLSLMNSW